MEDKAPGTISPEILQTYLEEAAMDLSALILIKTIAFAMFAIGHSPGAYFFHHPRDELPRVRRSGVSIWIDCGGKFPVYSVQRDDYEWINDVESEVVFSSFDGLISKDIVYTTSDHACAIKVFKLLAETVEADSQADLILSAAKKPGWKPRISKQRCIA